MMNNRIKAAMKQYFYHFTAALFKFLLFCIIYQQSEHVVTAMILPHCFHVPL